MKIKTIKIAHLYYDLMNLYGETGNIKALKIFIERQGIEPEIHFLTIGDDIDFKAYDFYYIGAGSENNQKLVLDDLMKYKNDIKAAIEDGKMFLATGNTMDLFGKKIKLKNGEVIPCLEVFDYQAVEQEKRLVSEIRYKFDDLLEGKGRDILGFKNCSCNILHNKYRMFGFPNNIKYNNFYGMDFVGPVLIRNPYFTDMLLKILFESKKLKYKEDDSSIEYKAYHEYLKMFNTDI